MFEEIINFKIELPLTEETKNEVEAIYKFLIVFANGMSLNFPNKLNNFNNVLNVWIAKMQTAGWSARKLTVISGAIYREISNRHNIVIRKVKDKLTDYTPFPQRTRREGTIL